MGQTLVESRDTPGLQYRTESGNGFLDLHREHFHLDGTRGSTIPTCHSSLVRLAFRETDQLIKVNRLYSFSHTACAESCMPVAFTVMSMNMVYSFQKKKT